MEVLFLMLGGFLGGVSSGLFGVGGGVIFVPFLIFFLRLTPHQAVASSLAVMIPAVILAAFKHGQMGNTVWRVVPWMIIFALIGSWAGSALSVSLDAVLLKKLFAIFLFLVALKLFFSN